MMTESLDILLSPLETRKQHRIRECEKQATRAIRQRQQSTVLQQDRSGGQFHDWLP
jgi:hypothetical protein